jgi:hypothetical protein
MVTYVERRVRSGAAMTEYWMEMGEVGGRWTRSIEPPQLRQPVKSLSIAYDGKVQTVPLPTTIGQTRVLRFEIWRQEGITSRGDAYQSIEVHLPLWMPAALLLAYPFVAVVMGPIRKLRRRLGWIYFIGWMVVIASAVVTLFLLLPALWHDTSGLTDAGFTISPGIVALLVLWLVYNRRSTAHATIGRA